MFDTSREIEVKISAPGGAKTAALKFPDDEQWVGRMRKLRTVVKSLGRGKTTTELENAEQADLELFMAVRVDSDGVPFDGAEASAAIDRIARVDAEEAEREGDQFVIETRVPGAVTKHVLRMPSQKELLDYRRAAVSVVEGRKRQEIRVNLRAAGDLYEKLAVRTEGYAGPVPIIHKSSAVAELLAALRAEEEGDGEDF